MQLIVDKAIKDFLKSNYAGLWREREPLTHLCPPDGKAAGKHGLLDWAAVQTGKSSEEMFEDFGAWLARQEPIRRLLRFSGRDFADFVARLEELPGRAHMISADFAMPPLQVCSLNPEEMQVILPPNALRWSALLAGILRVMADDYGALGLISLEQNNITVQISDGKFAEGRDFSLSAMAADYMQRGA